MTNITPAAIAALADGDFENATVAMTPGGIEAQEAKGQQELVASARLPKDFSRNTREQYEALGFVFGDDYDDLFVNCTLPEGWRYEATEHSMHSDIVDEQGRVRVGVFYKAAFYDRNAHAYLKTRFTSGIDYSRSDDEKHHICVFDQGKPFIKIGSAKRDDWDAVRSLEKRASEWLGREYPESDNPLLHWDAPQPAR